MNASRELEESIYYAAMHVENPAERARFLDQACLDNPALRIAVDAMLADQAESERFFSRCGQAAVYFNPDACRAAINAECADVDILAEEKIGARIDRYQLIQRLGEGGCGVVFEAAQEEPVRRRVALKVIKLGMDSKAGIARFAAERQALALMDHPNIARVLDAGATRTGRLYFVMELVHGIRITDYCDRHQLDLRARLGLFGQICQAIQHAHQKGVVHRDIKPSNILVGLTDGVPVPRVIDFGIAKVIDGRLPDANHTQTQGTANHLLIGTPAYMSPEQAEPSGLDIDTRSDVYSLGVLLYELLVGHTPFDGPALLKAGIEEFRRTLREVEPLRPSAQLAKLSPARQTEVARLRRCEPSRLLFSLKGDLDWIVVKALEKDRRRRYESVSGLLADLNRFLAHEPVIARPPSRLYRFGKLLRRNREIFAAVAAVTLALLAGTVTSTWLLIREREARREQARLRENAEQAERREAALRWQAVARETITRAAIAVKAGDEAGADLLLESVKTFSPELSFDSVSAFRHVGEWHAIAGRWDKAAERFSALMEIDKLDTWEIITLDYQSCGVVLAESGDRARFNDLCRAAIANFSASTNADATGRILKTLLLQPASSELLVAMRPLATTTETYWLERIRSPGHVPSWEIVPLALWSYRQGDYALAVERCQARLASSTESSALNGVCRIILAMCEARMGDPASARARLALVSPHIEEQFRGGLKREWSSGGLWYDWLFARILWNEAAELAGAETPGAVVSEK